MNNRYLFRAKRIDNGEWVEGCLMVDESREGMFKYRIQPEEGHYLYAHPVDPSTICQCTGLTDKNGNLIWENDIIVGHIDDKYPENATYVRVMWRNNGFCTHQRYFDDFELLDEFDQNNFEVCGNIFDNPELLEVEE